MLLLVLHKLVTRISNLLFVLHLKKELVSRYHLFVVVIYKPNTGTFTKTENENISKLRAYTNQLMCLGPVFVLYRF